jgi:hypothetical protein
VQANPITEITIPVAKDTGTKARRPAPSRMTRLIQRRRRRGSFSWQPRSCSQPLAQRRLLPHVELGYGQRIAFLDVAQVQLGAVALPAAGLIEVGQVDEGVPPVGAGVAPGRGG